MRIQFSSALLVVLMASMAAAAEPATLPSATQPAPKPTKVSIDLDNVTAQEAVAKLGEVTGLNMRWQSNRSTTHFSLHAKNQPLLDVIADICTQGHCLPMPNYGQSGMGMAFGGKRAPLAAYRPSEMTLLLLESTQTEERIALGDNSPAVNQSCSLELALITDPALQVAAVRPMEIERFRLEDGSEHPNARNDNYGQQNLRLDAITAWNMPTQFESSVPLGKKITVYGTIRFFVLEDFVELTIDDPGSVHKSFGNDELKCTITKSANNDSSVSLLLTGSLLKDYHAQQISELFNGGMISAMDESDQPLPLNVETNQQGAGYHLTLRPQTRNAPATVIIRLPRAAHQIELLVVMADVPLP
jgi:hypothetical protein